MLCYCVRKSKHRVNKDNTLLYSARFNLVKPSHADSKSVTQMEQKPSTICSFFRELQYDEFNLIQTWVGIRSYAYFNFCAIVTTFYICFCIDLVKMSNKFKRISISMIIIILIIKVDYNYHKNYPRIIWGIFLWKLYNFDNFIRRRLSDHNKITFVSLSPSLSPDGAFLFLYYYYFIFLMGGGGIVISSSKRNFPWRNNLYVCALDGLSIPFLWSTCWYKYEKEWRRPGFMSLQDWAPHPNPCFH